MMMTNTQEILTNHVEYREIPVGHVSGSARAALLRTWAERGWETVGLHEKGRGQGGIQLVAIVRRYFQESAA